MPTEREPVEERLAIGNAGWVRYQSAPLEPTAVFVRFQDEDGRLVARELYVSAEGGAMDPEQVRRLPLGRIEAWANETETAEHIRSRLDIPGSDLRGAISYFDATFGRTRDGVPRHWVHRMQLAQIDGSDEPQAPARDLAKALGTAVVEIPELPNAKLDVPASRPYPDDFYRDVAKVYSALAASTRAPAGHIADANGVPVSSVHRWVKRTRALGFLQRGQRGRAG